VGWIGAVAAYLVIAITGLTTADDGLARAAYRIMELLGWWVIVPSSIAALASGLVQSIATDWKLTRYYWILSKLVLTVFATLVLLRHMQAVGSMAAIAADPLRTFTQAQTERLQLVVHPAGGLVVLLIITAISVFKPWGLTPFARRERAPRSAMVDSREEPVVAAGGEVVRARGRITISTTLWRVCVAHAIVAVVVLGLVLHLSGGGMHHH
jgi:hypothetical protein